MKRALIALLVAVGLFVAVSPFGEAVARQADCYFRKGTEFYIGTGCSWYIGGTQVTATAAELNITDGVTATAAEINTLDAAASSITATVSAEFSNTITVTVDVQNAAGSNVATITGINGWLSDAATCLGKVATAPTTGPTIVSSAGSYIASDDASSAKGNGIYTTDATGNLNFTIANTTADTFYWCAITPISSAVFQSVAITFQ